jgi:hypothetical protein
MSAREPAVPSSSAPHGEESGALRCARHRDVETFLRCGRCETPICPRCQILTPVGARCRTCAQVKRLALVVKPKELLRAAGMGVAVAMVGGVVLAFVPFLSLLGLAFIGFAVGEAVSVGANRKQGVELGVLAVACLFVGYALSPFLRGLLAGAVLPLDFLLLNVVAMLFNPMLLLGLAIGGLLAWMRAR